MRTIPEYQPEGRFGISYSPFWSVKARANPAPIWISTWDNGIAIPLKSADTVPRRLVVVPLAVVRVKSIVEVLPVTDWDWASGA